MRSRSLQEQAVRALLLVVMMVVVWLLLQMWSKEWLGLG
jgi:hypothetical protein